MKKIICLVLCLLLLCGCNQNTAPEREPIESAEPTVTKEPFEDMPLSGYACINFFCPDKESELFAEADAVVVGVPINTFTDDTRVNVDYDHTLLRGVDGEYACDTLRTIEIEQVLKGDFEGDTFALYVDEVVNNGRIENLYPVETSTIHKQNAVYLFYLYESFSLDGVPSYCAYLGNGWVNLDGNHPIRGCSDEFFEQVKVNHPELSEYIK